MSYRDPPPGLRPALILRPLTSDRATGKEGVKFGGLPQLPEWMEWPRSGWEQSPSHFFAQIDLVRLEQTLSVSGKLSDFPAFPDTGTIFLFLQTQYTASWEPHFTVRFTDIDVSKLPERLPPGDIGPILNLEFGHHSIDWTIGLKHDGQFREHPAEVLAVASTDPEHLWDVLKPPARSTEQPKHAKRIVSKVPAEILGHVDLNDDDVTWEFIFEWARIFLSDQWYNILSEVENAFERDDQRPELKEAIKILRDAAEFIQSASYNPTKKPFFEYLFGVPRRRAEVDLRALAFAKLSKSAAGKVPSFVKRRFIELLADIHTGSSSNAPANLKLLEPFPGHPFLKSDLCVDAAFAVRRVIKAIEDRRADGKTSEQKRDDLIHKQTTIRIPDQQRDRETAVVPIQMFGSGGQSYGDTTEQVGNVLLFQYAGAFGTPICFRDRGVLKVWIDPEDLAAGRFDKTITTYEMTCGPDWPRPPRPR